MRIQCNCAIYAALVIPLLVLLLSRCSLCNVKYSLLVKEIAPAPIRGIQLCTYFGNRVPHPEPELNPCSWFKKNTCCTVYEPVEFFEVFVKVLSAEFNKSLITPDCHKYLQYLMCFVCSPKQYSFLINYRLRICLSFCDLLYTKCSTSYLDPLMKRVEETYANGKELCLSREFRVVEEKNSSSCFEFDPAWDSSNQCQLNLPVFVSALLLVIVFTNALGQGNLLTEFIAALFKITNAAKIRLLISVAVWCVVMSSLAVHRNAQILTEGELKLWTNHFQADLEQFGVNAMSLTKFWKHYYDVEYETLQSNPNENLKNAHEKFAESIEDKQGLTAKLYDIKLYNAQKAESWCTTSCEMMVLWKLVSCVCISKYKSSSDAMKYDYNVGQCLLLSKSPVKIQEKRNCIDLVDAITWRSYRSGFFTKSRELSSHIRSYFQWTYRMLEQYKLDVETSGENCKTVNTYVMDSKHMDGVEISTKHL